MKYNSDKNLVNVLLRATDITNTLSGGMSQPSITLKREVDHYLIVVRIPGVDTHKIHIEIVDKHIFIYHLMKYKSQDGPMNFPRLVTILAITLDIDYKKIKAREESSLLHIIMPFSELAGGYNRNIEIQK